MRGTGALRTSVAPGGALAGPWVRNELWRRARAVPSLDIRFAENKSLVDATTGQDLVSFTRASSGTSVDSQGVIRTATTNLLLRSEEFDNASWTKQQSSVSSNATTAPNGTLTADKLIEDSSNNIHTAYVFLAGLRAASALTFSVYAKSSERTSFALDMRAVGSGFRAVFNLSAQTATGAVIGSGTLIGTSIQSVGDGWFRCSVTGSHPTDTSLNTTIRLNNPAGTDTYTGDGTSGIYIWGAQLEQSSTVGEYIPTTSTINSAPRFDHNPTTGESLGLLREEQRTNLVVQSEDFGTTWTATGLLAFGSGSTLNAITGPGGAVTADLITEDTSNGSHRVNTAAISWAGNTQYTFSCFVKANGRNYVSLLLGTAGNWVNSNREAQFNLSNGTVHFNSGSPVTASIVPFPNGWYRLAITATTVASPSASSVFIQMMDNTPTSSYTGNGTSGLYLWGAQLEAGAFPTSYIPTTTAAATRSADVASISGSNFSSWYRQDEGTVFADSQRPALPTASDFPQVFFVSDGTGDNALNLGYLTSSVSQFRVRRLASNEANLTPNTGALRRVTAGAYSANNAAISEAGSPVLVDTSVVLPSTLDQLNIGSAQAGTATLNGTIRRLTYWPIRLGNSVLQEITR